MLISILLVVAALASLALGMLIVTGQRSAAAWYSFLVTVGCFGWASGIVVFLNSDNEAILNSAVTIYYASAALIAPSVTLFSINFLQSKKSLVVEAAFSIPLLLMLCAIIITPSALAEKVLIRYPEGNNVVVLQTSFYLVYCLYFILYYLIAMLSMIAKLRSPGLTKRSKSQLVYMIIAYTVGGSIGMLFNLILPAFGNYDLIWAGPLGLFGFVAVVYFAVARHGLFDIKQAAVRTFAYLLSLASLSFVYYILAYTVSVTIFKGETSSTVSINPINIALALVLAFIFQPIKQFFDKITDSIFFRDRYRTDDFIARISEVLTTTTDLRSLLQRAAREISITLKSEQAFFIVEYGNNKHTIAGTDKHQMIPIDDIRWLNENIVNDKVIVTTTLEQDTHLQKLLMSHKIAVLMPLVHKEKTMGYLALGEQRIGGYTNRDVKVLAAISDELIIAIQNSLSVQEVREINASLEQRIEAATAELRTSNARLKRIDASKDEFISMASHQLRTPLTSIKGYLSMVLEGDTGKITPDQQHLLQEAFTSSERMVHLIHDFLNVSRLQNGKFVLEQHPYDIVALVKSEVASLQRSADTRGLKLTYTTQLKQLELLIDETKVRQVVMNFIDNALYYSRPNGTINVKLEKVGDTIEFRVIDNGIGVPKAEQEHLFTKFFRAANARKQRPDGTGVGIFLAKKVINEHGGEIIFTSKEGVGSIFGFALPVDPLTPKSSGK